VSELHKPRFTIVDSFTLPLDHLLNWSLSVLTYL